MMTLIYAGGATYLPVLLCESLEWPEYGRVVGDDEVGLLLHALLQHVLRQVVRQHHPRHCKEAPIYFTGNPTLLLTLGNPGLLARLLEEWEIFGIFSPPPPVCIW